MAEALVTCILDAARAGANVIIHCRGGLGRSGLAAACCLVALGHSANDAIRAVRAARRGAIETEAQEAFVARFAAGLPAATKLSATAENARSSHPSFSRFRGCLLGGACGDALGYAIELAPSLSSSLLIREGNAPRDLVRSGKVALISDDTQMSLFVAEGVIRGLQRMRDRGICSMDVCNRFALQRWHATQTGLPLQGEWVDWPGWLVRERGLHVKRASDTICVSALSAQVESHGSPTIDRPSNDSKSCGAVMRSAPIGLSARSREAAFALGRDAGAITHGHPSGYLSAAYLASVIYDVSRGIDLADAMDLAGPALLAERGNEEMVSVIRRVHDAARQGAPSQATIEAFGGGRTGEQSLGIGLLCALTADRNAKHGIADALWAAVAHGGDSDTGSIAGNLLGALFGDEVLATRWLDSLELRDVIERVADDLYAASVLNTELDFESYPPN
jgi:ADP-ribosylglycohydrolase